MTSFVDSAPTVCSNYVSARPDEVGNDEADPEKWLKAEGAEMVAFDRARAERVGCFPSPTDGQIITDYYEHPEKRCGPERLYRHAYDVHSLDIVLPEIGLWKGLSIENVNDNRNRNNHTRRYTRLRHVGISLNTTFPSWNLLVGLCIRVLFKHVWRLIPARRKRA